MEANVWYISAGRLALSKEMEFDILYVSRRHYDMSNIIHWIWHFRKRKYVKGFVLRIFGMTINIIEKNATNKLIEIAKKQNEK